MRRQVATFGKRPKEFSPGSNGRMTTMGVYARDLLLGQGTDQGSREGFAYGCMLSDRGRIRVLRKVLYEAMLCRKGEI
ncbi:hypothetical protein ACLOJK_036311 [Asimina triloba]